MYSTPTAAPSLAARFARNTRTAYALRRDEPLSEDQMRTVAPSIFAEGKHASRSERYTYIPTIDVLRGLRKEGFEPFMVAQGASRVEGKAAFTKHMIRVRHNRDRSGQVQTRPEANEIILINTTMAPAATKCSPEFSDISATTASWSVMWWRISACPTKATFRAR